MSQENVDIVRRIYAGAVNQPEAIRPLYASDYVMDLRDIGPDIGVVRGFDASNEALRSYFDSFESFHIDIDEVIAADEDQVLLVIHDGGRVAGAATEIQNRRFHLWRFREGKVVRFSAHSERDRALEAAGLSE
jgi:ketosteroid isomerase-like protein